MKKFLLAIVLALPCLAASQQTAKAWCSFNIGIGASIGFECGGNCILWGALCGADGCGSCCAPCAPCGAPCFLPPPCPMPAYGPPAIEHYGMGYGAPAQNPNHHAVYYTPPAEYGYYQAPAYGYDW
jgi:hypothetical protein